MYNKIFSLLASLLILHSYAQQISGSVYTICQDHDTEHVEYLPGVNIFWEGTQDGTISNEDGRFTLEVNKHSDKLIASFVGYLNDTIKLHEASNEITFKMTPDILNLDAVVIEEKNHSSYLSKIETLQVQNISSEEFQKAACCNLSESFETNASVDVSFSDAISGAKQIELLGLDGKYVQMMTEKIPNLRGLSSTYGLSYIPGSWMESIQISKGTSTVSNGYESMTGQINVEFKKPDGDESLYLNAYTNHIGKIEGNINAASTLNEKISAMVFGHVSLLNRKVDHNKDHFLDTPLNEQYNIYNRWKYKNGRHIAQLGIKYLTDTRKGGEIGFDHQVPQDDQSFYGLGINSKIFEVWGKTGYQFHKPGTSIGFINNYIVSDQSSFFGWNTYNGFEKSYYANLIFSSWVGRQAHQYSTGFSFLSDQYNESINDSTFYRTEKVPGAFLEYTYAPHESLVVMAGIRSDYHNLYGLMLTPRFHLKKNLTDNTVLRISGGKGYRSPNLIAENVFILAGSRDLIITEEPDQEIAWNFGLSVSQYLELFDRELIINLDAHHTNFINQLIIDRDQSTQAIYVSNLHGKSFSNSYQLESIYELIPRLDVILAFRYNDVKMTLNEALKREPLVNRYKGLFNLSYQSKLKKWQFDFTYQLNGDARLPDTKAFPAEYQQATNSPAFSIINTQVTKYFKNWNLYFGIENLGNFTQKNPIIASQDPFGDYFDSSIVWGPIMGRKMYFGIKYSLKK